MTTEPASSAEPGRASTHTEIYRRFEGELKPHALRFAPLLRSQIRVLQKKKLPLLLLYAGPTIAGIVFSFVVYGRYSLMAEIDTGSGPSGASLKEAMLVAAAQSMVEAQLEVRRIITAANLQIQLFGLLVIGWFGAGLIAEDKKLGAHLLYFSRPMSKFDYFLGHYLTVAWFGLLAMLGPGLLICLIATFTSPDYSFIKEDWGLVLATIGNGLFTVSLLALMTLAVSSLVKRKSFALMAIVALIAASTAVGGVLWGLQREPEWMMIGFWNNVIRVGDHLFGLATGEELSDFDWPARYSYLVCAALAAVSGLVLWWRLRELEGVG